MSGHIKQNGANQKRVRKRQKIAHCIVNAESLPLLIDSGSNISILPVSIAKKLNLKTCKIPNGLSANQTQGILALKEKCHVDLKILKVNSYLDQQRKILF